MLCPSFCLGTRATKFVSEAEMIEWERTGARGKGTWKRTDALRIVFARLPHVVGPRGPSDCTLHHGALVAMLDKLSIDRGTF